MFFSLDRQALTWKNGAFEFSCKALMFANDILVIYLRYLSSLILKVILCSRESCRGQ